MTNRTAIFFAVLLFFAAAPAYGQRRAVETDTGGHGASVAFYNVENLFDTIPSLFYDDSNYTPQGRLCWDSERYSCKLKNLSRVIDDIAADVIGLAEVENETALRDLVRTLATDYNYIHHTGNDRRGIDLALLYKGDKFIPGSSRLVGSGAGREFLYVRGELAGEQISILVCHMPSQMNSRDYRAAALASLYAFADALHAAEPGLPVVVMGDFNTSPSERVMRKHFPADAGVSETAGFIFSPFAGLAAQGQGTYCYNDRWLMYDNIFLSHHFSRGNGIQYTSCGVFIRRYMLTQEQGSRRGYPLRTFSAGRWLDGYSDHLPVFVVLDIPAR